MKKFDLIIKEWGRWRMKELLLALPSHIKEQSVLEKKPDINKHMNEYAISKWEYFQSIVTRKSCN